MTKTFLRNLAERALTTYLEALLGFLILADSLEVSRLLAIAVAALPAMFSVVKNVLADWLEIDLAPRNLLVDLLERTLATYAVTFLGLVIVNPGDVTVYRLAAVSSLPAGLAVLKGFLASRIGDSTASLVTVRTKP